MKIKNILTLLMLLIGSVAFGQTFDYSLNYNNIKVGKSAAGMLQFNGLATFVNQINVPLRPSNDSSSTAASTAWVKGLNYIVKQQNVIYLSNFTDSYTGIDPSTKHNEGSAIVKAYNSITDTTKHYTIYFEPNKTYFPTGFTLENGSYWKKPNISFIGVKPKYAQDGKSLVSGTVVLGTFAFFANNLYFDGLGIDAGFNYSANYGFSGGAEAFIPCFNPDQSAVTERTNIIVKNIIILQKPNALFHALSMEFANGGLMDNITTLYGYHGQVIKSKNIKYTNGFAYGHHGEGLIVKSDVYAVSQNVSVDGLIVDTLPKGVKYLETVTHRMGVLINPASDKMYNIKINNITVNGYQQGIMAFGLHDVNGLQIDNLFANNCAMAMSNELISGINVQIGKISAIGTGGSAYGYRQIDGNYTTTIQSISLKDVPYGMSVPNGSVYVQSYSHDGGVGAFDISGSGHIYTGTTILNNLTTRNLGSSVDQPLPQFGSIGTGIMKNNSTGIPSIATPGMDYVIPSAIANFLPKSAGNTNALTGPLYIDRPSISMGSQVILSTLLAPDWYFGTDIAGSVNKADFSLYNFGAGNALNISKSTNEVLISGNLKLGTLIGTSDRAVFAGSDGTLKIGSIPSQVQNSLSPSSTTLAPSVDAVNAGLNTSANWKGESLAVTSKAVGDFIYYNGTNWINKQITATAPLSWNNTTGNMSFNDSAYPKLSGGNSFTGVQNFTSGSVQLLSGFTDSGFINTLSAGTLTTNVSTYLPPNGGVIATINDLTQTVSVSGTSQALSSNRIYIPHSASLTTFSLPTTASEGQLFQIVGEGSGGWRIAQNASQQIVGVNVATTSGSTGYVQSTNANCTITIRCTVANSKFTITSSQGTLTIN